MYNSFKDDPFQKWHSDNGGEFISKEMQDMIKNKLGKEIVHGRPQHLQSQGQVERVNGTLKRKIKSLLARVGGDWSTSLQSVTDHYNLTVHSTIKMTPYKVRN